MFYNYISKVEEVITTKKLIDEDPLDLDEVKPVKVLKIDRNLGKTGLRI